MMTNFAKIRTAATLAPLTLLAGACGGTAAPPPAKTASTAPITAISFNLAWSPEGYQAPLAYGVVHGIFRRYGFDVHLVTGTGSQPSVEAIANHNQTFGLADGSTLATLVSKGIRAVAVMGYIQASPIAIIVNANAHITNPRQLAGKTLAVTPTGPTYELLPAFLRAVGLSPTAVHELSMSGPARIPAIVAGKAVGEPALGSIEDGPVLASKGIPVRYFLYSQYGIQIPETLTVITSPQEVSSHPQTVQRFVAALRAAIGAAERHPRAAVAAMAQLFPASAPPQSVMLEQWKGTIPFLQTPADQGKPLGWMAQSDWETALRLAQTYTHASPSLPVSSLYTNRFVDAAAR
jgi:NitT/TauT family transport system substrate-binding protein